MPKRRKDQNGEGFMDFIKGVGNAAKKVIGVLKDTKILSTVGSMIPHAGVQSAARLAGSVGLGKGKGRKHGYKHKPGPKKGKKQSGNGMNMHNVRSGARATPLKL